ncbi:MAG: hypothetical protein HQM08_07955 [Candidatus Riflebacteria bacterium]|nr:hypothetical protein [Candidatus Riflebacteria bacterium]
MKINSRIRLRIRLVSFALISILCVACAASAVTQVKPWTILVYMCSDNDLEPYGQKNLQQMAKVGSSDFLNIVVLCDRKSAPASLIYVEKNNLKVLKNLGPIDSGNIGTLVSFAKENIAAFPAEHYILELWGHGQGWRSKPENPIFRWVSYDETSKTAISIENLGKGLNEIKNFLGKKIDVLAYDACLMQMVEVACSIRGNADYIVGSEEVTPGDGLPYDVVFGNFKPGMTPFDLCKMWVDSYVYYYAHSEDKYTPATLSVLDDNNLGELQTSLENFAKIAMEGMFTQQIKTALAVTQRFYLMENKDLGDFLSNLKKNITDPRFLQAIANIENAYSKAVAYSNFNNNFMKNATGMAIYFPETKAAYDARYDLCAYGKKSNWNAMLKDYLGKLTVDGIVQMTLSGDLSELKSFVQNDAKKDSLTANLLIERLNFETFAERGLNGDQTQEVTNLLKGIK